jgi:hypothetical protein
MIFVFWAFTWLIQTFRRKTLPSFQGNRFFRQHNPFKFETKPNMLYHGQKEKYGHQFKNNHHENPERLEENKGYKTKHETIHLH